MNIHGVGRNCGLKEQEGAHGICGVGTCRDSAAGIGFTTAYKTRGDCQTPRKSYKTYQTVGWFVGWEFLGKITPNATLYGKFSLRDQLRRPEPSR
jgi:hypothetical protein